MENLLNKEQLFDLLNSYYTREDFKLLAIVASISLILLSTLFYCCCCTRLYKGSKKTRVYGKIRDITFHHGSGKKKTIWVDPFRPSNIDFQRRFEDEITKFLYLLGVDMAHPYLNDYFINFQDLEGNACDERKRQYFPDYRWILKHFSHNCREYVLLLMQTKEPHLRQKVHQQRDPGWTADDVLARLSSPGYKKNPELLVSLACRIKELCQSLKEGANKRAHNTYLQDEIENEGNTRRRDYIMNTMSDGVLLVELIRACLLFVPKSLKDHYYNITTLQKVFVEEFLPCVDISRTNKKRFAKINDDERKREALLEALEEIIKKGNEDALEVMAVSVLPRFNYTIDQ